MTGFYKVIEGYNAPSLQYRAMRNLASCFYRKKEYSQARKYYLGALKKVERDVPSLCDLTIICMEAGDLKDASDFLAMATKMAMASSPRAKGTISKGISIIKSIPINDETSQFHASRVITDSTIVQSMAYLYCGLLFESQMKYSDAKLLYDKITIEGANKSISDEVARRLGNLPSVMEGSLIIDWN